MPGVAVDRFGDAAAVLVDEGPQRGRVGGDECCRYQVRELQRQQVLVAGSQAARVVDDGGAGRIGEVEDERGVEVGLVHRRIGPKEDGARVVQPHPPGSSGAEPRVRHLPAASARWTAGGELDRVGESARPCVDQFKITCLGDPDSVAAFLGGVHQSDGRVDTCVEVLERVRDEQHVHATHVPTCEADR